jgi:type I restriction enzyme M protein
VLTPGRFVGAAGAQDDDEVFGDKMERLTTMLAEQMSKGLGLSAEIRSKLQELGYEV